MFEITPSSYIYALYAVMIAAIASFLVVVYYLRNSDIPIVSTKLFLIYFSAGLIGWIGNGLIGLGIIPASLIGAGASYMFCSYILLLAVSECSRFRKFVYLGTALHLLLFIYFLQLPTATDKLLLLISYASAIYLPILYFVLRDAWQKQNIGQYILAFAIFQFIALLPVQFYYLLARDDFNTAYNIGFMASATGFMLIGIGFLTSILINEHKLLSSMALMDPLTTLFNRRGLESFLPQLLAQTRRQDSCISVIVVDIDHFKKINDNYGHDGGDLVLQKIASILVDIPRANDIICRWGGEEFLILLPQTETDNAQHLAEKIRTTIANTIIEYNQHTINLTASLGLASACGTVNFEQLFKQADTALYNAKEQGRNRVIVSQHS